MKKLLLIFYIIGFCSCKNQDYSIINGLQEMNIKGKVNQIKYFISYDCEKGEELIKNRDKSLRVVIIKFNEAGNIIEEQIYEKDTLIKEVIWEYDQDHRVLSKNEYNINKEGNRTLSSLCRHEYIDKTKEKTYIKRLNFFEYEKIESFWEKTLDKKGNVIHITDTTIYLDYSGISDTTVDIHRYEYNKKGQYTKFITYKADSPNRKKIIKNAYNKKGDIISENDLYNLFKETYRYIYDTKGNWIKSIQYIGKSHCTSIYEREISYTD